MRKINLIIFTSLIVTLLFNAQSVCAKDLNSRVKLLETRLDALEEYISNLEPTLNDYSKKLLKNVEISMKSATDKVAVLNPVSREVSKLETNTGTFLVAVKKMEKFDEGYRLFLQIGNPNSVTYSGVTLRLFWGKNWDPSFVGTTFEEWRLSLKGAEYTFSGALESGRWTDIVVDLAPVEQGQFEHVECEMDVKSVMLSDQDE